MDECVFCKIIKNEIPTKKVFENDVILAFLDINPCSYGHTVVIPKKHHRSVIDMPPDETGRLFENVVMLAGKIKAAVAADGFNMGVNDGRAAGQVVDHVHIHIIPRWTNDGGGAMQSIIRAHIPKEKLDEVETKIKSALKESGSSSEGPKWGW